MTKTTANDSGSFSEASVQFGTEAVLLSDIPEDAVDTGIEGVEDVDLDVDPEAKDVDKVDYMSADEFSRLSLNLPVCINYPAYTFILLACVNADRPLDSTLVNSAFGKDMQARNIVLIFLQFLKDLLLSESLVCCATFTTETKATLFIIILFEFSCVRLLNNLFSLNTAS